MLLHIYCKRARAHTYTHTRTHIYMYAYVWRDGVSSIYAMDRKNERGRWIFGRTQKFHQSPRSFSVVRYSTCSWRYASCGRRGMLILCDTFITRARPGVFYFHEVLRPVNIFDRSKVEEIFLTADRAVHDSITRESVETNRRLLPMHIISF